MDGDITTTLPRPKATHDHRILQLVRDLEHDGYRIGIDASGTGYWVKFPIHPTPDECGLMRLRDALHKDPALKPEMFQWLLQHRPYTTLTA